MYVKEAVELWGVDKTSQMIAILKAGGSKNLVNDIKNDMFVDSDNNIEFNIIMPDEAYYASEGREKGAMPNVNAIEEWAAERGIDREAAYPIALNIAKFGTKESGLKFLETFKVDDELTDSVSTGFQADVKNDLIKMINSYE